MELKYILTGGAGFIGSCILRTLNDRGITDITVVDHIASTEKWKNILNKKYSEYVHKDVFLKRLESGEFSDACAVIHMGACSSTTENNFDYLWMNNVEYSKALWRFCAKNSIPIIYASSAATYGNGSCGFDDQKDIGQLQPLNGYGYSKQVFDQWAEKQEEKPPQYVGLKFFNVYGPNEYCKGSMASMVYHGYRQMMADGKIRLFKSENHHYIDGGQERDFIYVKDVCKVIMHFLEHPECSGIYNVGTGRAQTFAELVSSVFYALDREPVIEYIDMPNELKEKYQYHTQAEILKLRSTGFRDEFMDVRQGVKDYVSKYLNREFAVY